MGILLKFKNKITRFLFGYVVVESVETRETTGSDVFVDITCTPSHQYYLSKDGVNWYVSHNCDDLVSEQTAGSKGAMEEIYEWWPQGFESRLLEGGRIVLINTRWSQLDPAGWLLQRSKDDGVLDQWKIISIPALLTAEASALIGHPEGTSYWPEVWKTETLIKKQRGMPRSQWMALYQQEPIALDGNIIKTENFVPFSVHDKLTPSFVLAVADTAFSTKTTADYSVIQIWAVVEHERADSEGNTYKVPCVALIDMVRGRFEYPDLVTRCAEVEEKHNPDLWLIEKKASGQSLIQDLRRRGYFIQEFNPDKDKVTRVVACTPFIDDKRVMVPDTRWADNFIDEAKAFPKGTHDDTIDCLSMAILYLRDAYHLRYDEDGSSEDDDDYHDSIKNRKRYW